MEAAQRKESLVRGRSRCLWLTVTAVVVADAVALALASLSHSYKQQGAGPLGFVMEHQKRKAPLFHSVWFQDPSTHDGNSALPSLWQVATHCQNLGK